MYCEILLNSNTENKTTGWISFIVWKESFQVIKLSKEIVQNNAPVSILIPASWLTCYVLFSWITSINP